MKRYFFLPLLTLLVVTGMACTQGAPIAAPALEKTPTLTPTPIPTPTSAPVPTLTETPTATPTLMPELLTAEEIFDRISPSVVFVRTPAKKGSGVLIEGGYVITNAHVVWPFNQVRVLIPGGSEYFEVPVLSLDLLGDLAVIGPIETDVEPLALVDGEDLPIGSSVFLIGYPAESEEFPQPTITSGILSRIREWKAIEITYLQTDAAIAGGQSGGVLVSDRGEVIGISGLSFSEARFGLVASAADVLSRVRRLNAGEDVAGLGYRRVQSIGMMTEDSLTLQHRADRRMYVINEPAGTAVDVTVESPNDVGFAIIDVYGNSLIEVDEKLSGRETGSVTLQLPLPHFLHIWQYSSNPGDVQVTSSSNLAPYNDPDDGGVVSLAQTIVGNLDLPADGDYFGIDLVVGDTIDIAVESAIFNPYVRVGYPKAREEQWVVADNRGSGIFGADAKLTYRAPHTGSYFVHVSDYRQTGIGGYILTVTNAPPGAVPVPMPAVAEQEEAARSEGFNLPAILPTLADLPEGATIESEGFEKGSDTMISYERNFEGTGLVMELGSSRVMFIGTSAILFANASDAESRVLDFGGLALEQGSTAEFARGFAEGAGFTPDGITAESLDFPGIGETSGGVLIKIETGIGNFDIYVLFLARGRIATLVGVVGAADRVALEDVTPLLQLIDKRIQENSPSPEGLPTPAPTPTPTPIPTARPTPAPRPIPIFGPASGSLVHEPDDRRFELFKGVTTGEDVIVEATFFNPYPTTKGSWSYGFLLRNSRFGYYHRVLVQSKGAWLHSRRLGDGTFQDLRSERSSNVDRTPEGKNHLRVIMVGDEGWVYINGVFEGSIDLSGITGPGAIWVVLGDEKEGEATRFEDFSIWSVQKLYGPTDGLMVHNPDDGKISNRRTRVELADTVVEARFFNPYATSEGTWSNGFFLRHPSKNIFHAVFIRSNGDWYHYLRTGDVESGLQLQRQHSSAIDTISGRSNHLRIVAMGDEGALFINGKFSGKLDLSGLVEVGEVRAFTGYFTGDEMEGEATRFEGFSIWSLAGATPIPLPTPAPTPGAPSFLGDIVVDSTSGDVTAGDGNCTLREAINNANSESDTTKGDCASGRGRDVITLVDLGTYLLTEVDETSGGPHGLPFISSEITINGNGSTIERDANAPNFRIFQVLRNGNLTLNDLTVSRGDSLGNGGAILNLGTLKLSNVSISGNRGAEGGGIFNVGTVTIEDSVISNNVATGEDGGAIRNASGQVTINNSTINGNRSVDDGGAIHNRGQASLTIRNSTISNNTAAGDDGGAIHSTTGSTLVIENSTISHNSAASDGGGINNQSGSTLTLINSTVSGNSAANLGGGIRNPTGPPEGAGIVTIINSTITNNSANDGGGVFGGIRVEIMNTILANNSGGDCSGSISSKGYNLDSDDTCGLSRPGDLRKRNPMLGQLQDNGGPTATHALLQGSPAIDAGDDGSAPAVDQRGIIRDQGKASDIGAFEREA